MAIPNALVAEYNSGCSEEIAAAINLPLFTKFLNLQLPQLPPPLLDPIACAEEPSYPILADFQDIFGDNGRRVLAEGEEYVSDEVHWRRRGG